MKTAVDRLLIHASELVTGRSPDGQPRRGEALSTLDVISDGALAIKDGQIVAVGTTAEICTEYTSDQIADLTGRLVSPGFVDPHTHPVSGGTRAPDWEATATKEAAPNIAGGISVTLSATRSATDEILSNRLLADLDDFLSNGTTYIEAKTGYGLEPEEELRHLRVLTEAQHPVGIYPTYLGAHMVPPEYADHRDAYIESIESTLERASAYTDSCDIACDPMSFDREESERIAKAATKFGFHLRVHADQTGDADGTRFAVAVAARTAEHLDCVSDEGLAALAASNTFGVIFPGATYHLTQMTPAAGDRLIDTNYPEWAKRLVNSGAALALSTDFNPGTSATTSMPSTMRLAMRLYRLSYAQVWNMATLGAAAALGVHQERGHIAPGARADLVIWNTSTHKAALNRFGSNLVHATIVEGECEFLNPNSRAIFADTMTAPVQW